MVQIMTLSNEPWSPWRKGSRTLVYSILRFRTNSMLMDENPIYIRIEYRYQYFQEECLMQTQPVCDRQWLSVTDTNYLWQTPTVRGECQARLIFFFSFHTMIFILLPIPPHTFAAFTAPPTASYTTSHTPAYSSLQYIISRPRVAGLSYKHLWCSFVH